MTAKFAEISEAVHDLSTDEKFLLMEQLVADALANTPSPHEAAWQKEIQRRREEVLSGKVKTISLEELERDLDKLLE